MGKRYCSEWLLSHIVATLGLGSTALGPLSACGGATMSPDPGGTGGASGTDAAVDRATEDAPSAGGDFDGFITTPPAPDHFCKLPVVESRRVMPNEICADDAGNRSRVYACLAAPASGQTCDEAYSNDCVLGSYSCGLAQRGDFVACGPLPGANGTCCYVVAGGCAVGRPFLVEGRARIAAASSDPSWLRCLEPDVSTLDAATREALADVWTQDALAEHASVASFSRFVLQCLSLGAPSDIVCDAQQACADEIEHARIGFGLATAYAGRAIGPGALDVRHSLDGALDATIIACSVASEGCIAESVSAVLIAAARDEARDPVVKEVLGRIAEQELTHSLLAWRYLGWAIAQGDDGLRREVARIFARMEDHVGCGAHTALPADPGQMRAHGYLPWDERRRIAAEALSDVVRPASRALLFSDASGERLAMQRDVPPEPIIDKG